MWCCAARLSARLPDIYLKVCHFLNFCPRETVRGGSLKSNSLRELKLTILGPFCHLDEIIQTVELPEVEILELIKYGFSCFFHCPNDRLHAELFRGCPRLKRYNSFDLAQLTLDKQAKNWLEAVKKATQSDCPYKETEETTGN